MNLTKSLTALSAIALLAGCGMTKKEKAAERDLTLLTQPRCTDKGEVRKRFYNVVIADEWARKYASRIIVTNVDPESFGSRAIYYQCKANGKEE